MSHPDVIVVGLGAMGTSACFHLARRGVRVLGLERFDIPHNLGSSHGYSRMTRMCYWEHPDYVPLLKSAYRLWHELEMLAGVKLIYITGGLQIGPANGEMVPSSLKSAKAHGLSHQVLDRDEIRRQFPQFQVPDDFTGLIDNDAGFILCDDAVSAQAVLAMQHGAELHGREEVLDFSSDQNGVNVRTSLGTYEANKLIYCGGAWTDKLVRDLGIALRVSRQVLAWVWPKSPELFSAPKLPVWAVEHSGEIHYGFPMMMRSPGFKLATHSAGETADPDRVNREITPSDEQTVRPFLREFMPQADGPLLSMRTCLYTNSPDGNFILDRHPNHERVLFACGFSGHGFKFAPVIGQVLADLATTGTTKHPVQFLSLNRK
jgi:sarcosine oxidase